MGAFFTNYQVRGKSTAEVCKVLSPMIKDLAYVSPEKGGWVTVYDFASDLQNQQALNRIAAELSKKLKTAVFAFLVHDTATSPRTGCIKMASSKMNSIPHLTISEERAKKVALVEMSKSYYLFASRARQERR